MANGTKCGAKTRAGTACRQPAGWGTDHAGEGRCRFHGGATPIRHGRYSKVTHQAVRELIEAFEGDDDPLDVLPEIAHVRALLTKFINRYSEIVDALLEWNRQEYEDAENEKRRAKPQPLPKLDDAIYYLKTAAQIAQKEKRLRQDDAVSRKDLNRVLMEMARVVEMEVQDEETRRRIKDGWSNIHLA